MARNKSGGLNKLLNFIGLVDDEDTRDTYGEEYAGGNYGRQSAYTPSRSARGSRTASRSSQQRASAPARSRFDNDRTARPSANYDDYRPSSRRSTGEYDSYRTSSRRASSDYDGYGASGRGRSGSRFEEAPRSSSRNLPQEAPRKQPQQRALQVSRRTRTVMYSLHTLKDCCKVIDELIANNTVVLTMEELEGHLMQRALDTLSGAAFALDASIRKASDKTYLLTPMSVEVNEGNSPEDDDEF